MQASPKSIDKRARDVALVALARALALAVRALPHGAALRAGRLLGDLMRVALPKRREAAESNLALAFPDMTSTQRQRILRDHFRHLGLNIVEALLFPLWDRRFAHRVEIRGKDCLEEPIKAGRGIVVFIPHTGNWEILAPLWPQLHPNPMVIVQPMGHPALDALVSRCRGVNGLELVPRQGALRSVARGLKEGRAAGFLADQDAGENGVPVSLFGKVASAEASPVKLARRFDCPIVLCAAFRNEDGSHTALLEPIAAESRDSDDESDRATLEAIYARLERLIRERPAQWLWIHRRWKTRLDASSR